MTHASTRTHIRTHAHEHINTDFLTRANTHAILLTQSCSVASAITANTIHIFRLGCRSWRRCQGEPFFLPAQTLATRAVLSSNLDCTLKIFSAGAEREQSFFVSITYPQSREIEIGRAGLIARWWVVEGRERRGREVKWKKVGNKGGKFPEVSSSAQPQKKKNTFTKVCDSACARTEQGCRKGAHAAASGCLHLQLGALTVCDRRVGIL